MNNNQQSKFVYVSMHGGAKFLWTNINVLTFRSILKKVKTILDDKRRPLFHYISFDKSFWKSNS